MQIADRLGRSPATVKAYFYDPTGEKARAVKARYQGVCRGCGTDTQPRNGEGDAYAYCKACHPGAIERSWTRERVQAAMWEWRERYGRLPSSYNWSRTHARRRGGEALQRLAGGAWPAAASLAACSGVGRPLGWQRSETRTRLQGSGRQPRRRDRSHKRFVCLIQRNPPQNPRVREEVSCSPNRAICRDFPRSTRCLHVIRVGEVPGSNPGAPIETSPFAGIYGGWFGRDSIPMESRYRVGTSGSLRFLTDEIPANARGCDPQVEVNGSDWRGRSAAKGRAGGKAGKCGFRWGELSGPQGPHCPIPA
jgi:hypothetical protein